jgi:hypothetical protein
VNIRKYLAYSIDMDYEFLVGLSCSDSNKQLGSIVLPPIGRAPVADLRALRAIAIHLILTFSVIAADVLLKVALGRAGALRWIPESEAGIVSDILTYFLISAVVVFCACTAAILMVCAFCSVRRSVVRTDKEEE